MKKKLTIIFSGLGIALFILGALSPAFNLGFRASAAPTSTIVQSLIVNNLKNSGVLCLHVNNSGYVSTSTTDCVTSTTTLSGLGTVTYFPYYITSSTLSSTSTLLQDSTGTIWVANGKYPVMVIGTTAVPVGNVLLEVASSTPGFIVLDTGAVVIGTTTPTTNTPLTISNFNGVSGRTAFFGRIDTATTSYIEFNGRSLVGYDNASGDVVLQGGGALNANKGARIVVNSATFGLNASTRLRIPNTGEILFGTTTVSSGNMFTIASSSNSYFNIASGGSVGIGTTTPTTTLDVNGSSTFRGNVFTPGLGTTGCLNLGSGGLISTTTCATDGGYLVAANNLSDLGNATTSRNNLLGQFSTFTGIGTTTIAGVTTTLTVAGPGTTSASFAMQVINSAGSSILIARNDRRLGIAGAPGSTLSSANNISTGATFVGQAGPTNGILSQGAIKIGTTTVITNELLSVSPSNVAGSNIFTVLSTGQVGVGTTTPAVPLHVWQTASTTVRIGDLGSFGCLEMGDTNGTISYIYSSSSVLTATSTKPAFCQ